MKQDKFLAELNDFLIHANQLCLVENALAAATFIQNTDAFLRYYSKLNQKLPLQKELDILDRFLKLKKGTCSRLEQVKIDIHESINKKNIFIEKFELIDSASQFITDCLDKSNNDIGVTIKLTKNKNLLECELKSSIGETKTHTLHNVGNEDK